MSRLGDGEFGGVENHTRCFVGASSSFDVDAMDSLRLTTFSGNDPVAEISSLNVATACFSFAVSGDAACSGECQPTVWTRKSFWVKTPVGCICVRCERWERVSVIMVDHCRRSVVGDRSGWRW